MPDKAVNKRIKQEILKDHLFADKIVFTILLSHGLMVST